MKKLIAISIALMLLTGCALFNTMGVDSGVVRITQLNNASNLVVYDLCQIVRGFLNSNSLISTEADAYLRAIANGALVAQASAISSLAEYRLGNLSLYQLETDLLEYSRTANNLATNLKVFLLTIRTDKEKK